MWGFISTHTAGSGVPLHTHSKEGLPLRRALPLGDGKVAQRQQITGALSREKPTWTNREKQPPPEQKGPEASEPLVVLDRRDPGWAAAGEGAALALVVEGGWPRGPGAPETDPRGAGDPGVPVLILPTPRPAGSRRPVRGQPGAAGRPHGSHRLRLRTHSARGPRQGSGGHGSEAWGAPLSGDPEQGHCTFGDFAEAHPSALAAPCAAATAVATGRGTGGQPAEAPRARGSGCSWAFQGVVAVPSWNRPWLRCHVYVVTVKS